MAAFASFYSKNVESSKVGVNRREAQYLDIRNPAFSPVTSFESPDSIARKAPATKRAGIANSSLFHGHLSTRYPSLWLTV
jgi:hypothetical protein